MKVTILSFSYKRGLPEDKTGDGNAPAPSGVGSADERSEELSQRESRKSPRGFVFDCRAMPNPHGDESLRGYTGRDKPIADFFAIHTGKKFGCRAFSSEARLWYNTQWTAKARMIIMTVKIDRRPE